ncbi:MAG: cysteine--tRNA ligase [Candidatus Marinimicrobia bacterium]|jgi:cysteinyl-tRNA synthetase|nr:cysteine--tRNA ligase [Candidatus Neomarinimicrobiota bacterium]MBT3937468.1 cysteine--tRNA ligase [Candidatus Neomarinimicrobiota bacterium]MBT3961323.1 cysteine--tRNA ligase [Candidatus Neomarinimicrobiota bacterium]MBT4383224.1 cysteine--tRNA ligase [Candidatus Neomarinimicrobiota bacterium]MBT4635637.1 cysteine--tRNA ligase [Candidatus Neomarinimicrobiota bacterium]
MLYFYNTLTRKKEFFNPIKAGFVSLYTCGPTVYDEAHIGNFRTFMFEDLLKRVLILSGLDVKHVMNITDVDDKTIKRASEQNKSLRELTEDYTQRFYNDLDWLKIIPADEYPLATLHVDGMILMIRTLLEKGHAYKEDDGSVYFKVDSFQDYGQLSNLVFEEQLTTSRIISDEYSKETAQDFALWKGWKPEDGEVYWDAPWGKGRPGWHIECSSMSVEYLGEHFDIHCGGVDNMFPHHENEIAQSQCSSGKPFVNTWLHSEHLMVEGGKMSKSEGNFYTINELKSQGFTPENIRYQLLSGHYRTKINFSLAKKQEGEKVIRRLGDFKVRLMAELNQDSQSEDLPAEYKIFKEKLFIDLDTPNALAVFFEYMRKMNTKIDSGLINIDEIVSALLFVEKFDYIFGIIPNDDITPDEIKTLAKKREAARIEKDWALADEIRSNIDSLGWEIKDTPSGTKLSKK